MSKKKILGCSTEKKVFWTPENDLNVNSECSNLEKKDFWTSVDDLDIEVIPMYDSFPINSGSEMYHTEKIDRAFSPTISRIGKLANALRRRAVFIGRQMHFLVKGNREGKCLDLARQFPDLALKILEFMKSNRSSKDRNPQLSTQLYREFCLKLEDCSREISDELYKKLSCFKYYESLYHFLKDEQVYLDLSKIYSQIPQQVLRYVADMWYSYDKALSSWFKDASKFSGKPNIPNYKKKSVEFKFGIPHHFIASTTYAKRIVKHYYNTKRTNNI